MSYVSHVSRTSRLLACAGGGLALWFGVLALPASANAVEAAVAQAPAAPDNAEPGEPAQTAGDEAVPQAAPKPYQAIIARNVFGLKDPPPPPAAPDPQAQVTPSALKLSILTTMFGKRASFVLQEPGKPPVNSDLLREGEKDGSITNLQVLQIDERAGSVKVVYGNKELTLDFKSNGIAPPVGPPVTPAGPMLAGKPGGPPGVAPVPGQPPQAVAAASFHPLPQVGRPTDSGSGLRTIPARPTRLGSSGSTTFGLGGNAVGGSYGYNQAAQAQAQEQSNLSAEQQALLLKVQEQQAARQGIELPPTPPLPGLDYQPGTQGTAQGQGAGTQFPPMPGSPIPVPPIPGR